MRVYKIRYDLLICMILAAFVVLGVGKYFLAFVLSGERAAACINRDGIQEADGDSYLMPIGRVVYAGLSEYSKLLRPADTDGFLSGYGRKWQRLL